MEKCKRCKRKRLKVVAMYGTEDNPVLGWQCDECDIRELSGMPDSPGWIPAMKWLEAQDDPETTAQA